MSNQILKPWMCPTKAQSITCNKKPTFRSFHMTCHHKQMTRSPSAVTVRSSLPTLHMSRRFSFSRVLTDESSDSLTSNTSISGEAAKHISCTVGANCALRAIQSHIPWMRALECRDLDSCCFPLGSISSVNNKSTVVLDIHSKLEMYGRRATPISG
jgi:hypothetical protein